MAFSSTLNGFEMSVICHGRERSPKKRRNFWIGTVKRPSKHYQPPSTVAVITRQCTPADDAQPGEAAATVPRHTTHLVLRHDGGVCGVGVAQEVHLPGKQPDAIGRLTAPKQQRQQVAPGAARLQSATPRQKTRHTIV